MVPGLDEGVRHPDDGLPVEVDRPGRPIVLDSELRGRAPVLEELGDLPVDYEPPLRSPHTLVVDRAVTVRVHEVRVVADVRLAAPNLVAHAVLLEVRLPRLRSLPPEDPVGLLRVAHGLVGRDSGELRA